MQLKKMKTTDMVRIAILAAISFMLTFFEIAMPVFAFFLKLDFSELPVLIGGLLMGPAAAILIELIKNILAALLKSSTQGLGEVANFAMGCAYILPLLLFYKRRQNHFGFVIGALIGMVAMVATACLMNYFVLIPLYSTIYGAPISDFVAMIQKLNGFVTSFEMLIVFAIAPFNVVKAAAISVSGYVLYRALQPVMKHIMR